MTTHCVECLQDIDLDPGDLPALCGDPACLADWTHVREGEGYLVIVRPPGRAIARGKVGFAWSVALVVEPGPDSAEPNEGAPPPSE